MPSRAELPVELPERRLAVASYLPPGKPSAAPSATATAPDKLSGGTPYRPPNSRAGPPPPRGPLCIHQGLPRSPAAIRHPPGRTVDIRRLKASPVGAAMGVYQETPRGVPADGMSFPTTSWDGGFYPYTLIVRSVSPSPS